VNVTLRERGEVTLVELSGNMMGGAGAGRMHEAVKSAIAAGRSKFLFDLAQVKWINSLGIGALIAVYKSICDAGGRMVLMRVDERVRSILMITRLLILFEVCESEAEAVDVLTAPAPVEG
jgi:anti-sigma B factor antagonist